MVSEMPAALSHRSVLIGSAIGGYALIFASFLVFEVPGLGIGHFYYLPVVLVALASGPGWGAIAGLAGGSLWVAGVVLNPHIPSAEVLTLSSVIRLTTYTTMGVLVGWFARDNRALVQRLRVAADRDYLTNLLNARAFDRSLAERLESGESFGLILGDMDGLKEVNDQEGHSEGNDVLRRTGELLKASLEATDILARVGGDEFAVLTREGDTETIRATCSRLTAALAPHGVSMSFGWSVCPRDGDNALLLFRAADERLYAQKLIRSRLTTSEITELPSEYAAFRVRSVS
jgi:diguanylate cyclase (GGDEF)-like protein